MSKAVLVLVAITACKGGDDYKSHLAGADKGALSKTTESICYLAKHTDKPEAEAKVRARLDQIVDDEAATTGFRKTQIDCIAQGYAAAKTIDAAVYPDAVRAKIFAPSPATEQLYAKVPAEAKQAALFQIASDLERVDHISKRGATIAPLVLRELESLAVTSADPRYADVMFSAAARWQVPPAKTAIAALPEPQQIAGWRRQLVVLAQAAGSLASTEAGLKETLAQLARLHVTLDDTELARVLEACASLPPSTCDAFVAATPAERWRAAIASSSGPWVPKANALIDRAHAAVAGSAAGSADPTSPDAGSAGSAAGSATKKSK